MVTLRDLTEPPPPPGPADWNDMGVVYLRGVVDNDKLADYETEWLNAYGTEHEMGGWQYPTPYMEHPAMRAVLCDATLCNELSNIIGEQVAVNLALTGWVSTERNWHQDAYLNPPHVGDHYAAIWLALADVHPDSGPFQYVPGSHRWPQVTQAKIAEHLDINDPTWPKQSEAFLTRNFEAEIHRRGAEVISHFPTRGDVLVWHGRLLHRGSTPIRRGTERRSLIAHYSGINSRPDFPTPRVDRENGGLYFPLVTKDQPVSR